FCCRNTLHPVHTTFELQCSVNVFTLHFNHDFFVSTCRSFTLADDCRFPAFFTAIPQVHIQQVTGKQRCFIPTCPCTDLKHCIFIVLRIFWNKQSCKLLFQYLFFFFQCRQFH